MSLFTPRLRWVSNFVLIYYGIGLSIATYAMNLEFMFYGAVLAVILAVVVYMDRRVQFTAAALWGMAIWGFLHLTGGLVPIPESITEIGRPATLYNMRLFPWFPKMDQIVHAYGFAMTTLISYQALCSHYGNRLPLNAPLIAQLFFIATGLGALNEVIEFIAVLLMPHTNVGGYVNTGWDLVSNCTGSATMILILWRLQKRNSVTA